MEPICKFRVNGCGDFAKNVSNVLSHFFYRDGLLDFWNLWKWNRYVSLELMGVEISPRTFLMFFFHFFYRDGLLDFWNLWKWNRYVSLELMGVEISPRTF